MTNQIIELKADARKPKEKLDPKYIPAILYGSGTENLPLKIKRIEFEKIYSLAGESSLINLQPDGEKTVKIIVKSVQRDPVKNSIIHVDLFHVSMNKEITTEVPLEFIGESTAVKEQGGFLITEIDSFKIECLPGDLVNHFDIDISVLKNIGDLLRVEDIKAPKGIKILNEPEETVVSVVEPRKEEVAAPAETAEAQPATEQQKAPENK